MDSCDFSLDQYTAVPNPEQDPELKTFSLERDKKYIIPMIKEAMELSEIPLSVLLSPWSPPASWKIHQR
jgi:O-Glycosyl hydrolase